MGQKVITVKLIAATPNEEYFKEYKFPELQKLLDEGCEIQTVYQATTQANVGFVFLTFVLSQ